MRTPEQIPCCPKCEANRCDAFRTVRFDNYERLGQSVYFCGCCGYAWNPESGFSTTFHLPPPEAST
jgi:hypothetical protein